MIHALGDMGINAIDTAEQYSGGESERRVGEALKGRRDQWVISTKFGFRIGPDHTRDDGSQPETIMPSLEGSLKRLDTDYIDIYLYHCPPELAWLDEGRDVLEAAKVQGEIRSYGISTNAVDLVEVMVRHDTIEVLQFSSNLLNEYSDMWKLAQDNNLGIQVRGVMAQGRLSGRYFQKSPEFRRDDNRSNWCRDDDYTRFAPLGDCLPEGITMAQAAIRWILDHSGAHTICMGAKRLEDYRTAIQAVELDPLADALCRRLEETAGASVGLRDAYRNRLVFVLTPSTSSRRKQKFLNE